MANHIFKTAVVSRESLKTSVQKAMTLVPTGTIFVAGVGKIKDYQGTHQMRLEIVQLKNLKVPDTKGNLLDTLDIRNNKFTVNNRAIRVWLKKTIEGYEKMFPQLAEQISGLELHKQVGELKDDEVLSIFSPFNKIKLSDGSEQIPTISVRQYANSDISKLPYRIANILNTLPENRTTKQDEDLKRLSKMSKRGEKLVDEYGSQIYEINEFTYGDDENILIYSMPISEFNKRVKQKSTKPNIESIMIPGGTTGVYISKYSFEKLCKKLDVKEEINKDFFFKHIYENHKISKFFNKLDLKYLFNVKNMLNGEISFYEMTAKSNDSNSYVFEQSGRTLKYHLNSDCVYLKNDYQNYTVPSEIGNLGIEAVKKYRDWFIDNKFKEQIEKGEIDKSLILYKYNTEFRKQLGVPALNENYELIKIIEHSGSITINSEFTHEFFLDTLEECVIKTELILQCKPYWYKKLLKHDYLIERDDLYIREKMKSLFYEESSLLEIIKIKEFLIEYRKIKEIVIKNLIDYFMWTFKKGIIDFDKITFENFGLECCKFCETENNSSSIFDPKHREIKVLFISSRSLIFQDKFFFIAKVQTHDQILNIQIHEEDRDYYERGKTYSCIIVRDNKGKIRYELGLEITD